MLGIRHLLSPVALKEFWETYWGKQALFVRGKVDKFPDLFGWDALTGLINEGQTSPNAIRLVYDKQPVPPHEAVHVSKWLKKGATLIVNSLNLADPMVGRVSGALARDLNTVVNTNCYSSWPKSQGFDLHYDGHDVYVVNVEGRKSWKVFEPTFPHPLERHARHRGKGPEDAVPYLECTMDVGDVLYIPRGHWHYAMAETPSMHLTLGAQPRTQAEFLQWLATQVADNDSGMRRDFTLSRLAELGGDLTDALQEEVEDFRERLMELLEPEALKESLLRFAMLNNPARRFYQLPDLPMFADIVKEDTWLTVAPDQKVVLRQTGVASDEVAIIARGRAITVKGFSLDFVRWMLDQQDSWQPKSALEANDAVTWQALRDLLEALFDNNLIRLA